MSRRSVILAIAVSLTACSAVPSPSSYVARIERVERGLLPPVLVAAEPSWTLSERMQHYRVPGVSVAVIENFEVAWAKAYGIADADLGTPVTEGTLFQAASISKTVAAAAVMRLVDEQRLTLATDVNTVLRSWKLPENGFTQAQAVTFSHLLSHSAGTTVHGFPGYASDDPVPSLLEVLDGRAAANTEPVRVDKTPGAGFRYSGGGTTIVQQAMQDLSGLLFTVFMRRTVLEPVGMARSTFEQPLPPERVTTAAAGHLGSSQPIPGKRHTYPEQAAAGLWTTPAELARFAIAIQRSARGDSAALLSQSSAQRMLTPVAASAGIGFFVDSPKPGYFSHGGGNEGFRCLLIAHKKEGYGAVVMTNGENGAALISELIRSIAREYRWEAVLPDELKPVTVEPAELKALEGRWRIGADLVLKVAASKSRLKVTTALEPEFELIPVTKDTFVRTDRSTRYRFSGEGEALHLMLVDDAKEGPAVRRATAPTPSELLAAGETEAARVAYRRALEASPEDATVARARLTELGDALVLRGDVSAATALLDIATELYPTSALALYSLAEAHIAGGDREAAASSLRRALTLVDTDPEVASFRKAARYAASKRLRSLTGGEASAAR